MSLRDITTEFKRIKTIETDRKKIYISKAIDDEVYEITTYVRAYGPPINIAYSLAGVEFLSKERFESKYVNLESEN